MKRSSFSEADKSWSLSLLQQGPDEENFDNCESILCMSELDENSKSVLASYLLLLAMNSSEDGIFKMSKFLQRARLSILGCLSKIVEIVRKRGQSLVTKLTILRESAINLQSRERMHPEERNSLTISIQLLSLVLYHCTSPSRIILLDEVRKNELSFARFEINLSCLLFLFHEGQRSSWEILLRSLFQSIKAITDFSYQICIERALDQLPAAVLHDPAFLSHLREGLVESVRLHGTVLKTERVVFSGWYFVRSYLILFNRILREAMYPCDDQFWSLAVEFIQLCLRSSSYLICLKALDLVQGLAVIPEIASHLRQSHEMIRRSFLWAAAELDLAPSQRLRQAMAQHTRCGWNESFLVFDEESSNSYFQESGRLAWNLPRMSMKLLERWEERCAERGIMKTSDREEIEEDICSLLLLLSRLIVNREIFPPDKLQGFILSVKLLDTLKGESEKARDEKTTSTCKESEVILAPSLDFLRSLPFPPASLWIYLEDGESEELAAMEFDQIFKVLAERLFLCCHFQRVLISLRDSNFAEEYREILFFQATTVRQLALHLQKEQIPREHRLTRTFASAVLQVLEELFSSESLLPSEVLSRSSSQVPAISSISQAFPLPFPTILTVPSAYTLITAVSRKRDDCLQLSSLLHTFPSLLTAIVVLKAHPSLLYSHFDFEIIHSDRCSSSNPRSMVRPSFCDATDLKLVVIVISAVLARRITSLSDSFDESFVSSAVASVDRDDMFVPRFDSLSKTVENCFQTPFLHEPLRFALAADSRDDGPPARSVFAVVRKLLFAQSDGSVIVFLLQLLRALNGFLCVEQRQLYSRFYWHFFQQDCCSGLVFPVSRTIDFECHSSEIVLFEELCDINRSFVDSLLSRLANNAAFATSLFQFSRFAMISENRVLRKYGPKLQTANCEDYYHYLYSLIFWNGFLALSFTDNEGDHLGTSRSPLVAALLLLLREVVSIRFPGDLRSQSAEKKTRKRRLPQTVPLESPLHHQSTASLAANLKTRSKHLLGLRLETSSFYFSLICYNVPLIFISLLSPSPSAVSHSLDIVKAIEEFSLSSLSVSSRIVEAMIDDNNDPLLPLSLALVWMLSRFNHALTEYFSVSCEEPAAQSEEFRIYQHQVSFIVDHLDSVTQLLRGLQVCLQTWLDQNCDLSKNGLLFYLQSHSVLAICTSTRQFCQLFNCVITEPGPLSSLRRNSPRNQSSQQLLEIEQAVESFQSVLSSNFAQEEEPQLGKINYDLVEYFLKISQSASVPSYLDTFPELSLDIFTI